MATANITDSVRSYWEQEPCGSSPHITGDEKPLSPEWFRRIENHRYEVEPMIHSVAQFSRFHGAKMLEVGVGAGTDHLQWARAGCDCHGVDLTDAAIEATSTHLSLYGLKSNLQRINAQHLPFPDEHFDLVYSWGVIHHADQPEKIIQEIHRVLRPGGVFIGMLYNRNSVFAWVKWLRYALFKGKPGKSMDEVISERVESIGTKVYRTKEIHALLEDFSHHQMKSWLTIYDTTGLPHFITRFFQPEMGWFTTFQVRKPSESSTQNP